MVVGLSCTGEGFGHAARTAAFAHTLRHRYHLVIFCPVHLFPFMRENLGDDVDLEPLPYFHFVKARGRIAYGPTVIENIPALLRFPVAISRLARRFRRRGVQVLLSDYDPFGAYAAASRRIPVLQINHPAVVLRHREMNPLAWIARVLSMLLMGPYQKKLIVSFYDGDLGPIVRPAITARPVTTEDFFVVYTKPTYRRPVLAALKRHGIRNVEVFPQRDKDIASYLRRCRGVIASAGHQLISEALVLEKPLLVIPQAGQYEQMLNARMLERSGWGMWAYLGDIDAALPRFVATVGTFPRGKPAPGTTFRFRNDLGRASRIIHRFIREHGPRDPEHRPVSARPERRSPVTGTTSQPGLSA